MSKREEMYALVEECKNSGRSGKAFCKEKGIVPSTFYYWKKKYNQGSSTGFVTIKPTRPSVSKEVELIFPNGVQLRMNGSDPGLIAKLVQLSYV